MSRSCCGSGHSNRKRAYRPFERRKRSWPIVVLAILVVAAMAIGILSRRAPADVRAQPSIAKAVDATDAEIVQAADGAISLPVSALQGTQARFYAYQAVGQTIPFFVLRSADGVIRSAFDACDVCYEAKKGYHQEGDELVCNNCGSRFPSNKVNEIQGGCNPAPLARQVQGDRVLIRVADLEAGARYF